MLRTLNGLPACPGTTSTAADHLFRGGEAIVLEALAELELGELARGRVREIVDELDSIRQPPGCDMLAKMLADFVGADVISVCANDASLIATRTT